MDRSFKQLIDNIMLTEEQKNDAITKIKNVCKKLHEHYYPQTGYSGDTKILIGSYGKNTNIRPPYDVDVLFKMPDSEFQHYDSLSGNKQSRLLQDVRDVLTERFSTTERIRAFGKVIVVEFADGTHNIELLPAWQLTDNRFIIPNSEAGGSWETWDPVAEKENITNSNKSTGRTSALIRIMKSWKRHCNVPMSSFLFELLIVNYLEEVHDNAPHIPYTRLSLLFFEYLINKGEHSVYSPASNTLVSTGDGWFSRAETAFARAEKAISFEDEGKLESASQEWRKIFGNDFPLVQDKHVADSLAKHIEESRRQYPSAKEQYLTEDWGIPFAIDPRYEVNIDAKVNQSGFRKFLHKDFIAKRFPLLKGASLDFVIVNNNVPEPYDIMWKVRNFGNEAYEADDLRGEISRDKGKRSKHETTKYLGDHYVECYIVKNGECVAWARKLVPIGSNHA